MDALVCRHTVWQPQPLHLDDYLDCFDELVLPDVYDRVAIVSDVLQAVHGRPNHVSCWRS